MESAQLSYFQLIGFGPSGWGLALLAAAGMTFVVAACGFAIGSVVGAFVAWAKISSNRPIRIMGDAYTTVLRGVPDLLVIYLFYFGGSAALTKVAGIFGAQHFVGVPALASGALAIGVVSAAYQAEVFRGAFQAIHKGELEAARSVGMRTRTMFRRVVGPQVLRFAVPSLGNLWQIILKESALVSVTGVMELLNQSKIAAGATYRPFDFYFTAATLFLVIGWASSLAFNRLERHSIRGLRRGS